ncbi:MAG: hypothetical protein COS95_08750, partial [Ignavibacteriales bacterium CG07_land_8_20_14_0_80_59_12]
MNGLHNLSTRLRLSLTAIFAVIALTAGVSPGFAQPAAKGTIIGTVTDARNGEGLPNVTVLVKGTYYGVSSDLDGKFRILGVSPGEYTLVFSIIGYKRVEYTGVKVRSGEETVIKVKLEETALTLGQEVVIVGEKPLFDIEETQSRRSVSSEDIAVSAVENVQDIVTQQVGVV